MATSYITSSNKTYKKYVATLSQSGDGTSTYTSGPLVVGKVYEITTYISGDDFSNVANVISGTTNTDGCLFLAIGDTPTNYSNGSTLRDTSAPTANVFENTIGDIIWTRSNVGEYYGILVGAFGDGSKIFINPSEVFVPTKYGYSISYDSADAIGVSSSDYSAWNTYTASDNILYDLPIEIRIYS